MKKKIDPLATPVDILLAQRNQYLNNFDTNLKNIWKTRAVAIRKISNIFAAETKPVDALTELLFLKKYCPKPVCFFNIVNQGLFLPFYLRKNNFWEPSFVDEYDFQWFFFIQNKVVDFINYSFFGVEDDDNSKKKKNNKNFSVSLQDWITYHEKKISKKNKLLKLLQLYQFKPYNKIVEKNNPAKTLFKLDLLKTMSSLHSFYFLG